MSEQPRLSSNDLRNIDEISDTNVLTDETARPIVGDGSNEIGYHDTIVLSFILHLTDWGMKHNLTSNDAKVSVHEESLNDYNQFTLKNFRKAFKIPQKKDNRRKSQYLPSKEV